jgi:hypothetical protein
MDWRCIKGVEIYVGGQNLLTWYGIYQDIHISAQAISGDPTGARDKGHKQVTTTYLVGFLSVGFSRNDDTAGESPQKRERGGNEHRCSNHLSPCTAEIVFLRESCMKRIKGKGEEKLALSLASSHPVK